MLVPQVLELLVQDVLVVVHVDELIEALHHAHRVRSPLVALHVVDVDVGKQRLARRPLVEESVCVSVRIVT